MKLRNDYNVQHMIEQFPPFAGRIFVSAQPTVVFQNQSVICVLLPCNRFIEMVKYAFVEKMLVASLLPILTMLKKSGIL